MRIAFITPEFITEEYFSGGLANYVYRVAKALVEQGHEVHVITLSQKMEDTIQADGVQVHRLKTGKLKTWFDRITRYRLQETAKWLDFSYRAFKKLKKLHREKAFDVAQFSNYRASGLFSSFFLKIPYVVRISSYRPLSNEMTGLNRSCDRISEWMEALQLKVARHIYGPSNTLKIILKERAKVDIQIIRSPFYMETKTLDESVYQASLQGKKYLLFFGRFQLHKGFHILAQALPEVLERNPDLYAVMVGLDTGSPLNPSMRNYAKDLCAKTADRLIFIDQLHHDKLYPIIQHACFVVLPSLIDNLPNTCLEAMAFGKPVIGTIGASFDELIIDGQNGFLVEREDVKGLTEKMLEVAGRKDLEKIGERAQRSIEALSPQYTVSELVSYYRDIINTSKRLKTCTR